PTARSGLFATLIKTLRSAAPRRLVAAHHGNQLVDLKGLGQEAIGLGERHVQPIRGTRAMPRLEATLTLDAVKLASTGPRHDPPVTFRCRAAEFPGGFDHERPGSPVQRAAHQLVADEPGGPIRAVAHEPLHGTMALHGPA